MPFSALLFDLDDTLLDTYGLLIPQAHRAATGAMCAAGLPASFDDALRLRLQLAGALPHGPLDEAVAAAFGCADPQVWQAGLATWLRPPVADLTLEPAAAALLDWARARYRCFLVTAGVREVQHAKVAALGIEHCFEACVWVEPDDEGGKEAAFQWLLTQTGLDARQVLAIGDRPDAEILAAGRLGMPSIRLRRGQHAAIDAQTPEAQAELEVTRLEEVREAIERLERRWG